MAGPGSTGRRLDRAFAAEERRGLELASWGRLAALLAILVWLALSRTHPYDLYYHGLIGLFLALGGAQLALLRSGRHRPWHRFVFAGLDGLLLAVILLLPNPFLPEPPPPAMTLRYANIVFAFVFLASAALTYSPALVLWTGAVAMLAWSAGVWWLASLDGIVTSRDPPWQDAATVDAAVAVFLRPDFLHVNLQVKKVLVVLVVTALLALVVHRARRLVLRQVGAERARTNLARYFSPNLVEQLAARDEPLSPVRRPAVAVLFADIVGFTTMCETRPPEQVIALLRDFREAMERAVFAHHGTLDKYLGDGLMATFGTPSPGPRDATDALAAARGMLDALAVLNTERARLGLAPLRIGIGIHLGPVVQGDVGGERRLEFTVLGDTVNVAARLEALTRSLGTPLVVSEALIDRVRVESAAPDLTGLVPAAPQIIRGRAERLRVWTLQAPAGDHSAAVGSASGASGTDATAAASPRAGEDG